MMKVSFAEVDEAFIRSKVENGYYSSVTEVIRDAVRRLRENEQHQLTTALALGENAIAEGRVTVYTPELMEESKRRAKQRAAAGEKAIRPNVTPY